MKIFILGLLLTTAEAEEQAQAFIAAGQQAAEVYAAEAQHYAGMTAQTTPSRPQTAVKPQHPQPQQKACSGCKAQPTATAALTQGQPALLIFVSASMPKESLRSLFAEATKIGGKLVFRGLQDNSFKQTQLFFQDAAIVADIDPAKFDDYAIRAVPTFVLIHGHQHDRLTGHVSVPEALQQFHDKGVLKALAATLSQRLKGNQS